MKRSIKITDPRFFSIFSDAILLHDLSLKENNRNVIRALSASSILSISYALEAAANSYSESLNINSKKIRHKIDRFSTLEKFDFILEWHQGTSLPQGDKEVQEIKALIKKRDELVHPKVKIMDINITTSKGNHPYAYQHFSESTGVTEVCPTTGISIDPANYSPADSLVAIRILVNFLNKFIGTWWKIDVETSENFLMRSWNGSIQSDNIMYEPNELKIVLKYDPELKITFVRLHGILEQFQ